MKCDGKKVTDLRIAYVGGGSRGWAWTLMCDLAKEESLSGVVALYDIDKPAAMKNEVIGNRLKLREDAVGKWDYEVADTLKDALTGADFVIISIMPGTFDEMAVDVHMPERYNLWQSVGDTAGPGGHMRALRTIPMFVTIAEAIKEFAPKAWVINYTNPMSLCVKTLYKVFPEIKAFGCCHEVFGTQAVLARIAKSELGFEDVKRSEVHVNVLGINHFTWFSEASIRGVDMLPVCKQYIEKYADYEKNKDAEKGTELWHARVNRVKFDLLTKYGWLGAAGDRHLVEFMPGDTYLDSPDSVKYWGTYLTTVDSRKKGLEDRLARSERLYNEEEQLEFKESGEEGVKLIRALCGLDRVISNVNIPNAKLQIGNLRRDAIVETNAVFSRDSIKPIAAGDLKDEVRALIAPHLENHEDILYAAMNCDFDTSLKAFMNDPLVKAKCSEEEAKELLMDMIKATDRYLPEGWKRYYN